jgi:hypothetical protein
VKDPAGSLTSLTSATARGHAIVIEIAHIERIRVLLPPVFGISPVPNKSLVQLTSYARLQQTEEEGGNAPVTVAAAADVVGDSRARESSA